MAIENVQEIKDYIEANKDNGDVKDFVSGFSSLDVFKEKITSNTDFTSFMDSEKYKYSSKALGTWKDNNLQKLIDEKIKELYPEVDPKDTELAKLNQKIEKMERDSLAKELKLQTNDLFAEKKFDIRLSEFVGGENIEQIGEKADKLNSFIQEIVANQVQEKLKSGYKPPVDTGNNTVTNPYAKETFSLTQQMELEMSNPEQAKQLREQA